MIPPESKSSQLLGPDDGAASEADFVCVVVVNWNGWLDTIVCLESLFAVTGHTIRVVVCDNASTDQSYEELANWLASHVFASQSNDAFENSDQRSMFFAFSCEGCSSVQSIQLIGMPKNLGYAGALNRGIVFGQQAFGARSFWLLNNDVKVMPDALTYLVQGKNAVQGIGLCGSVLLDWNSTKCVQAIGGIFRRHLAVGYHMTAFPDVASSDHNVFLGIDYPVGASLFVTKEFLDSVGLMDETYFLYYEEMDWVERGRRHGFRPAVALKSLVQHKEGASTGSHGGVRNKSILSERYGVVNRLRITRKFWPAFLPLVWMSLWLVVLDRVVHGEWARAQLILRLMFAPRQWLGDNCSC